MVAFALVSPAAAANRLKDVWVTIDNVQYAESSSKVEWRANFLLYKKFVDEHPWIHFREATNLRMPPGMDVAGADFTMAMVGGTAPDVKMIGATELGRYVDQGFLYPLDEYVKNWKGKYRLEGPWRKLFVRRGRDGKEHIYALPFVISCPALAYNRMRFRDVGLNPYQGPRDWVELWNYATRLSDPATDPETNRWKHYGMNLYLEGWGFAPWIPLTGGDWAKQNSQGTWQSSCTDPAAVKTLDFFKKMCYGKWTRNGLVYEGVMDLTPSQGKGSASRTQLRSEARDPFQSGVLAMSGTGFHLAFNERTGLNPDKFGVIRLPKAPGGRYANSMGGDFLVMKSTIKDKSVRDAAWAYMQYLCGDDGERDKVKIFVENGAAKYVNPVLLQRYGFGEWVSKIPPDWQKAYVQIFQHDIYSPPAPPGGEAILNELTNPVSNLRSDKNQDSLAALKKADKVISLSYLYAPTPKQMHHHRMVAFFIVGLLFAGFIAGSVMVVRTYIRENLGSEKSKEFERRVPRSKHIVGWLFMAPAVLSVLLWQYVPVLWGSVMAFMDVLILGGSKWVGLDNFIYVAARPLFWLAWKNTIIFVFMSLTMGFFAPVVLALLLSEIPRFKTLFRTLYYLPALTVGVVTLILWMQFYDPTEQGFANQVVMSIGHFLNVLHVHYLLNVLAFVGNAGIWIANAVAHLFGGGIGYIHYLSGINIGPQQWLQDPKMAMAATILPSVWAGMGPGCIIYLAALKAVPEELYDAADLDGAGIVEKVRTVTLPTLFPLVLINLLGAFIGAFHGAGNILVMTGGGPDHATHVMSLEIFYEAYVIAKYGYATAIAWMLASVLIGFTVLQMRIFSRMKFSTAEQRES